VERESLPMEIHMENVVDEILVQLDTKEPYAKSGVFVDGKRLPVVNINIDISPHGNDYVILKLHRTRVKFDVED
jgi:hypothetical protein